MHNRTKTHGTHGEADAATLENNAEHAISTLKDKAAAVHHRIKEGISSTEGVIKENPWTSVGVAAGVGVGVGLLVGLLMRRSD